MAPLLRQGLDTHSSRLHAFLDHWTRSAPLRADRIERDPDLEPFKDYSIHLDVLKDGCSFRYRRVGPDIIANIGRDFTGETVYEYHHRHESMEVLAGYIVAAAEGLPHHFHGAAYDSDGRPLTYERLTVPLIGARDRVDGLLACFEFYSA